MTQRLTGRCRTPSPHCHPDRRAVVRPVVEGPWLACSHTQIDGTPPPYDEITKDTYGTARRNLDLAMFTLDLTSHSVVYFLVLSRTSLVCPSRVAPLRLSHVTHAGALLFPLFPLPPLPPLRLDLHIGPLATPASSMTYFTVSITHRGGVDPVSVDREPGTHSSHDRSLFSSSYKLLFRQTACNQLLTNCLPGWGGALHQNSPQRTAKCRHRDKVPTDGKVPTDRKVAADAKVPTNVTVNEATHGTLAC